MTSPRQGFDFEPELPFPDNPFNAARLFMAVMAYPERGAGQPPDGLGVRFTEALWNYHVWSGRRAKGLRYIREKFSDPNFQPPVHRDFVGTLERGTRRMRRRTVAYSLFGTQLMRNFLDVLEESARLTREGLQEEAHIIIPGALAQPARPELWGRTRRSPLQIVEADVERWAKRFGLNATGRAADQRQKAKDLVRRAYLQSRPVMHMTHAFNQVCTEIGPKLEGWGDHDFILVLLWHPEAWVWNAIEMAETWRIGARHHFVPDYDPALMIKLLLPEKMRDIAP